MTERAVLLVIGIGNSLRRDDGAGLILARGLAEVWQTAGRRVKLLLTHQLVPELAETVAGDDVAAVLFVDAARATDDADDGCRLERVTDAPAPKGFPGGSPLGAATPSLGHHLGPALILLYAAQLFGGRPPAWLLRVPGRDFDHGEGLSPTVADAVATQLAASEALWRSLALPN